MLVSTRASGSRVARLALVGVTQCLHQLIAYRYARRGDHQASVGFNERVDVDRDHTQRRSVCSQLDITRPQAQLIPQGFGNNQASCLINGRAHATILPDEWVNASISSPSTCKVGDQIHLREAGPRVRPIGKRANRDLSFQQRAGFRGADATPRLGLLAQRLQCTIYGGRTHACDTRLDRDWELPQKLDADAIDPAVRAGTAPDVWSRCHRSPASTAAAVPPQLVRSSVCF